MGFDGQAVIVQSTQEMAIEGLAIDLSNSKTLADTVAVDTAERMIGAGVNEIACRLHRQVRRLELDFGGE